jgi:hypothetical protein
VVCIKPLLATRRLSPLQNWSSLLLDPALHLLQFFLASLNRFAKGRAIVPVTVTMPTSLTMSWIGIEASARARKCVYL